MNIVISEESINSLLRNLTDISGVESGSSSNFTQISFELYKETGILAILASNLLKTQSDIIDRNQAVSVGLIIRIAKFTRSVLALITDKVSEHGEVIIALNRCIVESAIKLRFFCEKASNEDFDNFIKSSLKPEKETFDFINKVVLTRGNELPIETRMLNSITRAFKLSRVDQNDLIQSKFKSYKEILKDLEMESVYSLIQGIPSHAIHGNWVDLLLHNLEENSDGFSPKNESLTVNTQLLLPISIVILDSLESYLNKYFNSEDKIIIGILERIIDLRDRIIRVDIVHERSLS